MRIEDIWYGRGAGDVIARYALLPLSWVYAGGWQLYLLTYRLGFKNAAQPHPRILCVGNLVAGGSGKTPVTVHLAKLLAEAGQPVVIGCSGYGSPRSEAATLAPSGELNAAEWGDEPAEFRAELPNIPIIVGRRRVLAAQICHEHFPDAVLLMDDGFQHLPLKKSLTIVLDPLVVTNSFCFPAGPYREPRSNRKRADLVLPNSEFSLEYSKLQFSEPVSGEVNALCAIGRPDLFRASLEAAGLRIECWRPLPDHDPLADENLMDCDNDLPWIVTKKDAVKLKDSGKKVIVARREVTIEPATKFKSWIMGRLS